MYVISNCFRKDILVVAKYFKNLHTRIASKPQGIGGLDITLAANLFSFAFLSSRFDTLNLLFS